MEEAYVKTEADVQPFDEQRAIETLQIAGTAHDQASGERATLARLERPSAVGGLCADDGIARGRARQQIFLLDIAVRREVAGVGAENPVAPAARDRSRHLRRSLPASPQTGKAPPAATVAPSAATPFPNCRRSTLPLHPICPQIYTKLVCRQASFIRHPFFRSEDCRVGKECVCTCRSRWTR